jgi:hypothetical protein
MNLKRKMFYLKVDSHAFAFCGVIFCLDRVLL